MTNAKNGSPPAELSGALTLVLDQAAGSLRVSDGAGRNEVVGLSLLADAASLVAAARAAGNLVRLFLPDVVGAAATESATSILPVDEAQPLPAPDRLPPPTSPDESFVAADRVYREAAINLGYRALPHAALARRDGEPRNWLFAALIGPRELLERLDAVPYDLSRRPDGSWSLLAALLAPEVKHAVTLDIDVQRLAFDVARDDAYIVAARDFESQPGVSLWPVLWSDSDRALIAMHGGAGIDASGIHGLHGHAVALAPDPGLMQPRMPPGDAEAWLGVSRWRRRNPNLVVEPVALGLSPGIDAALPECPATAASIQADIDRLSGTTALDASGPIASRHTAHPDNARVVDALIAELRSIGYCARREPFMWNGMTRDNVVADLPGAGLWKIRPDVLDRLRRVLVRWPRPDPPDQWMRPIRRLLGTKDQLADSLDRDLVERPSWIVRRDLEWQLGLPTYWPWWHLCELPGLGAGLIVVGCHLDSTAGYDPGYDPATGPARGADDDASGVAGTLAIARWMWHLRGQMRHTVRFCFFNGEEQGLVGSKAYASALKSQAAPVVAAVCMDMIGYNSDAKRLFEVHAGYTDPAVRDASVPVAATVASWAMILGALPLAQVYRGTSPAGGPDRSTSDGAINRSDHAAFHQQSYPAVLVSEDFFGNRASEPMADPNPNYHRNADAFVDSAYAADIVCAVAHAVRYIASG